MAIEKRIIEDLLKDAKTPEEIMGKNGLIKQLSKALLETALQGEMSHHLGYKKNSPQGKNSGNSRNGKFKKNLKSDLGEIELEIPRDRNGEFDPQIVKKGQRRFHGFDEKIVSMYARGMSTREIQAHLEEIYAVEVSPELISTVTSEVIEEVKLWQNRALDEVYPIVFLDALFVKVRDEGQVKNKAIYLAIGINLEGQKEVLGLWIEQTEGAKFWLKVMTELKSRGLKDIFIACVDGLKGFPEAIEAAYPQAQVQACIVHMVRNSLKFVNYKERKPMAADLKTIYRSATLEEAEARLLEFEKKWDQKYPMVAKSWRKNWAQLTTFFAYSPEIRKVIYTTNVIESLNMSLRKIIKNRRLISP